MYAVTNQGGLEIKSGAKPINYLETEKRNAMSHRISIKTGSNPSYPEAGISYIVDTESLEALEMPYGLELTEAEESMTNHEKQILIDIYAQASLVYNDAEIALTNSENSSSMAFERIEPLDSGLKRVKVVDGNVYLNLNIVYTYQGQEKNQTFKQKIINN